MAVQPTETLCGVCKTVVDPEVIYARFLVDFEARVGWPYDGKRPRWIRKFCSEPCRIAEEQARLQDSAARQSERRRLRRIGGTGQ